MDEARAASLTAARNTLGVMDYERSGRWLGTGMRILGRMANERLSAAASPETEARRKQAQAAADRQAKDRADRAAASAKKMRDGGRRFGASILGPVTRAGHSLFLEIAGLFFALFGVWFLQSAFRLRAAARAGAEHSHFIAYLALGMAFVYFSVTSFVRARRRFRRR